MGPRYRICDNKLKYIFAARGAYCSKRHDKVRKSRIRRIWNLRLCLIPIFLDFRRVKAQPQTTETPTQSVRACNSTNWTHPGESCTRSETGRAKGNSYG